jgi:hypothetical protein
MIGNFFVNSESLLNAIVASTDRLHSVHRCE